MIQLSISGDNPSEFMANLQAIARMTGETVIATPEDPNKPRRGRPPKAANEQAGTGAATTAPAAAADDDLLPGGKGNGAAADDIFGDSKPAGQAAETAPQFKTPEEFIEAVKKLLGKGKDDAVRGKLKELGFEKVRDVPADKYTSTLAELGKV
jgi:hypothetical protein